LFLAAIAELLERVLEQEKWEVGGYREKIEICLLAVPVKSVSTPY